MFLIVLYVIVLIAFVGGLISLIKYFKHIESWDKFPSSEEYWGCLAWGWCSLMLTTMCGLALVVGIFLLIGCIFL